MFLFKESLRRNVGRLDAQMWLLTAGQDLPRLIRPYLEKSSLLVSELLPVVRSGLFVPSVPRRISPLFSPRCSPSGGGGGQPRLIGHFFLQCF